MKTTEYFGHQCVVLENHHLQLLVTQSIGPRVLSLRINQGENIFAELPESVSQRTDGKDYHFYGGHRLWISPEDPIRSYGLDDKPVEVLQTDEGLLVRKETEPESGFEKSILIKLDPEQARVSLTHKLTNHGKESLECAAWAITQFRTGGVAILPQAQTETGLLPNRVISLWPYSDVSDSRLSLGNKFLILRAEMNAPFKIGFPNPRGWLAYWVGGDLFVKQADYEPRSSYGDFGSSSECYCCSDFLELETLSPVQQIEPGMSITHQEIWEVYTDIPKPESEKEAQLIAGSIGLE